MRRPREMGETFWDRFGDSVIWTAPQPNSLGNVRLAMADDDCVEFGYLTTKKSHEWTGEVDCIARTTVLRDEVVAMARAILHHYGETL